MLDGLLSLQFFQGRQAVVLFFLLLQVLLVQFQELDEDRVHGKAAVADSGDQVVFGAGVHLLGHAAQAAADVEGLPVMAEALAFPFQRFQAFGDVFFTVFLLEPAADLRAAFRTADDVQPVQARLADFGSDDFDNIAVL